MYEERLTETNDRDRLKEKISNAIESEANMARIQTVEKVGRVLRAQVCPTCRYRKLDARRRAGSSRWLCENDCPLFVHLDFLINAAQRLDPMISDRKKLLTHLLDAMSQVPVGRTRKHYRFDKKVVRTLENVFDDQV